MPSTKHALGTCALAALMSLNAISTASALDCTQIPQPRATTGRTILVSSTIARPNDGVDDTAALQGALDSLQAGDTLVFDLPGVYQHNLALYVRRADVTVDGGGTAELRGTNPDSQAIMIQSDGIEVRRLIINNVTDKRRTAPWHAAISVYSANSGATRLHRISILRNNLRGDGSTGTATQAAASGGIFVYNADGFVIASNNVTRTLADGIHLTGGSRNGRVIDNFVEETGDDGIAMVSYLGANWRTYADADVNWLRNTQAWGQVNNIYVKGNTVKHNYWGRGIAIVGGRDITIDNNNIDGVRRSAGLYIAREWEYNTMGVNNIWVRGNQVKNIATTPTSPTFAPTGPGFVDLNNKLAVPPNSGHGGIEIYGGISAADLARPDGPTVLPVRDVLVQNNLVQNAKWSGLRAGAYSEHIGAIGLVGNQINNAWNIQIAAQTAVTFDVAPHCSLNTVFGNAWNDGHCQTASAPPVTGFTCKSGQL